MSAAGTEAARPGTQAHRGNATLAAALANLRRSSTTASTGDTKIRSSTCWRTPTRQGRPDPRHPHTVKDLPPLRKIIGDLSDTERVLVGSTSSRRDGRRAQHPPGQVPRGTPRGGRRRRRDLRPSPLRHGRLPARCAPSRTSSASARSTYSGRYDLEVIDIYQRPPRGRRAGDRGAHAGQASRPSGASSAISDTEKVLFGLDLIPKRDSGGLGPWTSCRSPEQQLLLELEELTRGSRSRRRSRPSVAAAWMRWWWPRPGQGTTLHARGRGPRLPRLPRVHERGGRHAGGDGLILYANAAAHQSSGSDGPTVSSAALVQSVCDDERRRFDALLERAGRRRPGGAA